MLVDDGSHNGNLQELDKCFGEGSADNRIWESLATNRGRIMIDYVPR